LKKSVKKEDGRIKYDFQQQYRLTNKSPESKQDSESNIPGAYVSALVVFVASMIKANLSKCKYYQNTKGNKLWLSKATLDLSTIS